MPCTLEVPVDSLESALLAAPFATRLELCHDLASEGWTPKASLIERVRAVVPTHLVAMIRPRFADSPRTLTVESFVASKRVLDASKEEIKSAASAGAHSVAIGLLDAQGHVDMDACGELAELGRSFKLEVAFLRTFDLLTDRARGMRDISALGMKRVVTAGVLGWDAAVATLEQRIVQLQNDSANAAAAARLPTGTHAQLGGTGMPVEIVPGGGVRAINAKQFLGVSPHLHASCRRGGVINLQELQQLHALLKP